MQNADIWLVTVLSSYHDRNSNTDRYYLRSDCFVFCTLEKYFYRLNSQEIKNSSHILVLCKESCLFPPGVGPGWDAAVVREEGGWGGGGWWPGEEDQPLSHQSVRALQTVRLVTKYFIRTLLSFHLIISKKLSLCYMTKLFNFNYNCYLGCTNFSLEALLPWAY